MSEWKPRKSATQFTTENDVNGMRLTSELITSYESGLLDQHKYATDSKEIVELNITEIFQDITNQTLEIIEDGIPDIDRLKDLGRMRHVLLSTLANYLDNHKGK